MWVCTICERRFSNLDKARKCCPGQKRHLQLWETVCTNREVKDLERGILLKENR